MGRFDALATRRGPVLSTTAKSGVLRKRGNPDYRQFSAYLPVEMYRGLKQRVAGTDLDLSEAVEQAVAEWLHRSKK